MKYLLSFFFLFCLKGYSQNVSEVLERTLGGVITVAVYKTDYANKQLGLRGTESLVSAKAYEKALDLSGATSTGSGFIIDYNGKKYVATNAHVIANASDEPKSIYVFSVSRDRYEVKVLGGDSFYDYALLEFIDQPGEEITTLKYSETGSRIGEKVYAIGNPLGDYPYSVSDGIISAKNRVRDGLTGKYGFLQTTATLIWGNSGGPLINERGEVVGVNSQIAFTDAPDGGMLWQSQINFALESAIARRLTDDIITNSGRIRRSFFGLEITQNYTLVEGPGGLYIEPLDQRPVLSGLLARSRYSRELAGHLGAIISGINGKEMRNIEEVLGELENTRPGTEISLTLIKDGQSSVVKLKGTELTSTELETIAAHFLTNDKKITYDPNQPSVVIMYRADDMHQYRQKKYMKPEVSQGSVARFHVLAAGVSQSEEIWKVETLSDLGAAFRLSGLAGVLDFFAMPEDGREDDIQLFRRFLSDDENIVKKTLWY